MKPITAYSQWCSFDRLDDVDLQDGESLRVQFPDGEVITLRIVVKARSYEISDMGHPYSVPVTEAFAATSYHGVAVLVPLRGLLAERVST